MTLMTIDLGDVTGGHDPDDHVVIRAEAFRESHGGGVTSTAEVIIPLVDGVGQAEVEPGPVVVAFRCRAVADTREKRGVVPDAGPVGIEDVIAGAFEYTPPVVNRGLDLIEGARDEALGQVEGAVAAEIGDFRSGLVPPTVVNLWDYDDSTAQSMNILGIPLEHESHRLSPFIPVDGGEKYIGRAGAHTGRFFRALFFDSSYTLIPGQDTSWTEQGETRHLVAPDTARWVRIVINPGQPPYGLMIFNRGDTLWTPDANIDSGWWDDRELPPNPLAGELDELRAADVPPAHYAENLWDYDASTPQTMSILGTVSGHEKHRLSPFIPVEPGEYVSHHSLYRILFFTADYALVPDTDTAWQEEQRIWEVPSSAAFARMVIHPGELDYRDAIFNRGTILFDPDNPDRLVPSGWWDDKELPPADEVNLDDLRAADVPPAQYIENLWDYSASTPHTMSIQGTVSDHARHRLSPFLPVVGGEPYVSYHKTGVVHRVIFFDSTYAYIPGTDTSWQTDQHSWVSPPSAVWARMVIDPGDLDYRDAIFNQGTELVQPGDPPVQIQSGWWDDRELPPGVGGGSETPGTPTPTPTPGPHFQPSFPTLDMSTVYTGWSHPRWLSYDGEMLWGGRGHILEQSTDEWTTQQVVHSFPDNHSVIAVRDLDDGELLVATARHEASGLKAKIWRSSGYTRQAPEAATWAQVLEAGAAQAEFKNIWGLNVSGPVVVAGEYGLRGVEGSRRAWMSEDYGATWTLIFDQMTVDAPGQPEWVDGRAHLHTASWDPYWQRLWVVAGDSPSTGTWWSDDKGATWKFVPGSDEMQYTGIMPLPDTVVFGSDRAPNGLWVYHRGHKSDVPVIEPLLITDDSPTITKVFSLPYRRGVGPTEVTYFPAADAARETPSIITATVDGKKGHLLWVGETPGTGVALSGQVEECFGPTAQGNLIVPMFADPLVTGIRVMKAPAPTWQRV